MTQRSAKSLSALEHTVMQAVWSLGPSTAEEIRQALDAKNPLADSTVRTLLRRLEDKGFITHSAAGRTNLYESVLGPRKAAVQAVRQIIDRFCGGSVEELLVGLVADDVVATEELQELAEKIAKAQEEEETHHA